MLEIVRSTISSHIEIESTWAIPEGVTHPEYVIPDEVLEHVVRRLDLAGPSKFGIDPMCGNGTILQFINRRGGRCYGIELDKRHHEIASTTLSQVVPQNFEVPHTIPIPVEPRIVHGDCTSVALPNRYGMEKPAPFGYIYTSIPFREILDGTLGDHIAHAFDTMLWGHGFMVIDSADEAVRDGLVVNPAAATIEYFERLGFSLLDRVGFRVANAPPGCDDQFTELLFVKRGVQGIWIDGKQYTNPLSG